MTSAEATRPSRNPADDDPPCVVLADEIATQPSLVGGKAAALATARAAGIDTADGAVLTTRFCADIDAGAVVAEHPATEAVFEQIGGGRIPLVARSSSVVEDTDASSAAGQFESVIGIGRLQEFADAVETVIASRTRAGAADEPIAVLVQPMLEPTVSGVLFGIDPVSGRSDRRVITAVEGQPDPLVSGEVDGSAEVVDADGARIRFDRRDGPELDGALREQLVELASRAADVFGGPQDIEWAEVDGRLVLLQSRPVTTEVRGVPQGPVYGPGPVAETFPERLSPLEADLWIPPLRDAVREALLLSASVPESELDGPDLVVSVDGHAAIDLVRTGEIERSERRPPWFAVTRRIRRLRSAWRVGRLRSALPSLADRLVDRADDELESLPPLATMTDRQLVALLGRGRAVLRSLHAHEVLMGLLVDTAENKLTGTSVALRVLAEARTDGRSDAQIVTDSPVVLALTPPRIGPAPALPAASSSPSLLPGHGDEPGRDGPRPDDAPTDAGIAREALRLRIRWVQELTGRAAWTLGERLVANDHLPTVESVRFVTYDELAELVTRRIDLTFAQLRHREQAFADRAPAPLPARFRVSDTGHPITVRAEGESGGGTGAGGGTGSGPVTHDTDDPPRGSVLVVRTLAPGIGPVLGRLNGVVAETGSVLAHLAILAREAGVPTVVGHIGAVDEFPEGTELTVDGDTGQVSTGTGTREAHS